MGGGGEGPALLLLLDLALLSQGPGQGLQEFVEQQSPGLLPSFAVIPEGGVVHSCGLFQHWDSPFPPDYLLCLSVSPWGLLSSSVKHLSAVGHT